MKFMANDGTIFDDITLCQDYEKKLEIEKAEEKQKQIYESELANIKSFNIAFEDHNVTLFIHSLGNHKLFAIMICESLFGNSLKFKEDQIISDNIIPVYKITTNKTVNIDNINDINALVFEAHDVPKIFNNLSNILTYTPGGFARKENIDKSIELDNNIKKYNEDNVNNEKTTEIDSNKDDLENNDIESNDENYNRRERERDQEIVEDFLEFLSSLL